MVSAAFEVAYAEVGLLEKAPGQEEQLEVYSLAKVAQGEDIKSKPAVGMFNFAEKEKRKAWQKLLDDGMTPEEADAKYVEKVEGFKAKYGVKSEDKWTAAEKAKLEAAKAKLAA